MSESTASDNPNQQADDPQEPSPLRSVFSNTFPEIISQLGVSIVVSTYQAGYLIILRAEEGGGLNTHFRLFPRPMGMVADQGRLALGVGREIVEFRNMSALAEKLEPTGKHDACYIPRHSHITGDIDIHEMAFCGDELWVVNTRFCSLCTLDTVHSFVPRWRPKFVSALAPEDRCHLNGMEVVDGRVRYVTALGTTDTVEGWREKKASGGVLIDVESEEIICQNLSMPHSPRWYNDRLWLLESGDGNIGTVDKQTGRYESIVQLDGFTRGMDFCGPFAFVGLSQVRESAIFSGLPLTQRTERRICGVSIVNLQTGQEVGFVQFQDAVQEIFAIQVLPHRYPDVLLPNDDHVGNSYALPDEALAEVAQPQPPENPVEKNES